MTLSSHFYLPHSTQSDQCLNSLSCSAFIFLQLSCKIIAMIIKHPYKTLYVQSVSQSFILQSISFCKSSFIMSYVSLRTMFYMIRWTGNISISEAKVTLYSICISITICILWPLCSLNMLLILYQESEGSSSRSREVPFQSAMETACGVLWLGLRPVTIQGTQASVFATMALLC